jgi:hypothetical protein
VIFGKHLFVVMRPQHQNNGLIIEQKKWTSHNVKQKKSHDVSWASIIFQEGITFAQGVLEEIFF